MRGRVLTIWCVIVVALAAALGMLHSAGNAPAPTPAPTEKPPAYWMLYQREAADFQSLTVTLNSGEGYTLQSDMVYNGEGALLGVRNALGQPVVVQGREGFTLDSAAYQMVLLLAQNLPVTARYDALDRGACGLVAPDARLELRYAEGDSICLAIGKLTATGASCYVSLAEDDAVYLAPYDLHQVMTRPLAQLHRLPGASSKTADDALQLAVDGLAEGRIIATRQGSGAILPWRVDSPVSHDARTAGVEAFVNGVCALRADAYETTVDDLNGLAQYGLDDPLRLVAAFADGSIRDIQLGMDAGDGTVYARMDSSGDVYRVRREQLDFLKEATLDGLLDRYVALVPIGSVDTLTVHAGGKDFCMEMSYASEDAAQPDGGTLNGEALSREALSAHYAAVVGVQFDKALPQSAAGGDELACLRFRLRDGGERAVQFSAYDSLYALAETDGGGRFLVRLPRLEAMVETLAGERMGAD